MIIVLNLILNFLVAKIENLQYDFVLIANKASL